MVFPLFLETPKWVPFNDPPVFTSIICWASFQPTRPTDRFPLVASQASLTKTKLAGSKVSNLSEKSRARASDLKSMDYSGSNVKGGRDYFKPPNEGNIDQLGPGRELPFLEPTIMGVRFGAKNPLMKERCDRNYRRIRRGWAPTKSKCSKWFWGGPPCNGWEEFQLGINLHTFNFLQ